MGYDRRYFPVCTRLYDAYSTHKHEHCKVSSGLEAVGAHIMISLVVTLCNLVE
jgi:hypothetical protein